MFLSLSLLVNTNLQHHHDMSAHLVVVPHTTQDTVAYRTKERRERSTAHLYKRGKREDLIPVKLSLNDDDDNDDYDDPPFHTRRKRRKCFSR